MGIWQKCDMTRRKYDKRDGTGRDITGGRLGRRDRSQGRVCEGGGVRDESLVHTTRSERGHIPYTELYTRKCRHIGAVRNFRKTILYTEKVGFSKILK